MNWLEQHPEVRNVRCGAVDLNGQARGKRMPRKFAAKLEQEGTRFPLSVLNLDIWGEDIDDSPLVFESGDPDGVLLPTERGYLPMPWLSAPTALLPLWSFHEDGTPFAGDPRHALANVVARYRALGLTPVCATEMEFYLVDDTGREIRQPLSPRSGKRRAGAEILSLRALDAFDVFFNELYDACEDMDIPAEAAISEGGEGQFEVNLCHVPDALKAADDAWLFKMLVRGLARNHNMAASFMAKPYPDYAGNGLHTHFSVIDADGKNIFADGTDDGTDTLKHAVAGCLHGMADLSLIFAPHGNSFARLVPGSHAPTSICWGYDNRTASVRVPGGNPAAKRVEHRLAGGDVNPYLFLAAVLGSALIGIEDKMQAPAPIKGNAYEQKLPQVPHTWSGAIDRFEKSDIAHRIFGAQLVDNFTRTKRQEHYHFQDLSDEEQLALYLDTV
ncbi:glutamate--putrescine ligase [Cognatiyoonia koreensis]|uniref:Glutamate--putrescine ligase n=1 Tax=Cognatiyoonia koreensis TaxID=364200 RepID=A0A1I0Q775_9RHOB|nr:glutamine synthetase family protein [Cognatiyoonia koreensis]SEW22665.1 glutamate--putrescine ligase [Cognatiyoonia koreensis]